MTDCWSSQAGTEGVRRIHLREYETCETAELGPALAEVLRRHFPKYLTVQPSWLPGYVQLGAKQYVGTIVLDGVHILIEPKVQLQNLFYMLTYAYDLPQFRDETALLDPSDDLFEFVVEIFARQVEQLVRRGMCRAYIDYEENSAVLRGRLQLAEHLQRNAMQIQRFYQRTNEFTADILENRILKYTLWLLSRLHFSRAELRPRLLRALSGFTETSFVQVSPADCDRVVYTRLNASYRSRINLAKLLLQNLSLEGHAGLTPFATYLFDMNQVFELFVARYLERYFASDPLLQVAIKPSIWLDADQKERGEPDIVLKRGGQDALVLDTKYKRFDRAWEVSDRDQMFMYCHRLSLTRGILIYADDHPIHYRATFTGVAIEAQALTLSGEVGEFAARCQSFAAGLAEAMAGAT